MKNNFWMEMKKSTTKTSWGLELGCKFYQVAMMSSFQVTRKFDNHLGMYTFIFLWGWSHGELYLEFLSYIYIIYFCAYGQIIWGDLCCQKGSWFFGALTLLVPATMKFPKLTGVCPHYLRTNWSNHGGILLGDIMPAVECTWLMVLGLGGQKSVQTNGLRWLEVSPQDILNTIID